MGDSCEHKPWALQRIWSFSPLPSRHCQISLLFIHFFCKERFRSVLQKQLCIFYSYLCPRVGRFRNRSGSIFYWVHRAERGWRHSSVPATSHNAHLCCFCCCCGGSAFLLSEEAARSEEESCVTLLGTVDASMPRTMAVASLWIFLGASTRSLCGGAFHSNSIQLEIS